MTSLNARPRTSRGDVSNAEQHPFLRAARGGNEAKCWGPCNTDWDCAEGCHCNNGFGTYTCY